MGTGGTKAILQVAFAGTFSATLEPTVRARLGMPCDVILADETGIISQLSDVDVLITLAFTREMGTAAKRLKLVQVPGAGLDRIDRGALPAGVFLANVYGHEIGIAEYVLGAMLALTRGFARLDAALRQGAWESQWAVGSSPPAPWPELAGKTLGILGYGRIGQALARRARAFDMEVCAIRREATRSDAEALAFLGGPDALDEVVRRADYLAVTLSLTEATRGILGERELRMMKPTAVLINVARARDRRRRCALSRAGGQAHRGRRPRRLVSVSEGRRTDTARAPTLSRVGQRAHDTARVRLDRGHAGGAGEAHRGEHPADRERRAAAESDSLIG